MFNSGILDVVIGVVVVYLQLSLVCTAINELVALWLKKRSKELEKGIRKLLASENLGDKFFRHPLIQGLRPDGRKPSYIPARTFSMALFDIVRRASDGTATLAAARQVATDKATGVTAAQVALDAANTSLTQATSFHEATLKAVGAAGDVEKPAAITTAQDAASKKVEAETQVSVAQAKLAAAQQAQTEADAYLVQVTKDVNDAQTAAAAADLAEAAAAKANPPDKKLQAAALAARKTADEAADKFAPSAASLVSEAREKVASAQSNVVPPELKVALLALMDNAGTNLTKAQGNVEQWFDDAMDRVSGVYKRKSHVFVVIIAVFVTVLANVDTLQVADSLSHDKAVRDSLVAAAPELAKRGDPTPTPTPTPTQSPTETPSPNAAGGGAGANPTASPARTPEPTINSIKASLDALNKLSLPIGYIRVCTAREEKGLAKCAAIAEARALVSGAEAKRKQADANSQNAAAELKTAETKQKTAAENNQTAPLDKQDETKAALAQAEAELAKAKTTNDGAVAELSKANAAHEKAITSTPAELQKLEKAIEEAQKAETDNPTDENKKLAAADAQRNLEIFLADCPPCRKASELTEDQLTRRLPTTDDYDLRNIKEFVPAVLALGRHSLNLLYTHWLGWLLTAMAVSLGAPFWFDMLNKLIVVRSTVKPHEKSKEQESKDNSDEKDGSNKS